MNNTIKKSKDFIELELNKLCSAHDIYHIERVFDNSMKIFADEKKWDELIIWIWALFHEMLDEKIFEWKIVEQLEKIEWFLNTLDLSKDQKEKIIYIVKNIWFRKTLDWKKKDKFIEFQIVEDADRLESIWAIAIARTFAYWWKMKRSIYDPSIKPIVNMTLEQYRNYESTSLNHFYEKLFKLKDLINTRLWKEIATERHKFMEIFLEQFFDEWAGIK